MPDKNLKSYMLLIDSLESMADGAKKHGAEPGYPAELSEENIRTAKQELEESRGKYIQSATETSRLKEIYERKEDEIAEKVSRSKTMAYGYYGKKNKLVQDFGLKPYKERTLGKSNNGETKTKTT